MKLALLILKNIRRNLLRAVLTALGTMVLVVVVTLVWSVLAMLDAAMADKSENFKLIVTERWRNPSQMPLEYVRHLSEGAWEKQGDAKPLDSMTWQFYGGSLEQNNRTRESLLFAIAMDPTKITTMLDELDDLPAGQKAQLEQAVKIMLQNRQGIIVGRDRLQAINKQVGERIKLYGLNYKDIDLELEIVGMFPEGRYDNSAVINHDYLNGALERYKTTHGQEHPLYKRSLNLVWLRVPDTDVAARIGDQITSSPSFKSPEVKCESLSSGIAAFIEPYRDLIWGARWLLSPGVMITLSLVIANAISINVRERRNELAVMKVLGYRPWHLIVLVVGEALILGLVSGAASAALTYGIVNHWMGGFAFQIAFFPKFFVPLSALWWGLGVGGLAALIGSVMPALSARRVKVAEVFAKVA